MMDWLAAHAGVIGLAFFFTFFILMAGWVYRPGSRKGYQEKAQIPFKEM